MDFILTHVSTQHLVCEMSVMKVTRFSQIHNLKEQVIPKLNGLYLNCCPHLEQVNGLSFVLLYLSTLYSVCSKRVINVTRFSQIHRLKE